MVRMVAWANREALELTAATGVAHFWSRSRGALWRKGETSGNTLARARAAHRLRRRRGPLPRRAPTGRPATPARRPASIVLPAARATARSVDRRRPARIRRRVDRWTRGGRRRSPQRAARRAPAKSYVVSLLDAGLPKINGKIAEEARELAEALPEGDAAPHRARGGRSALPHAGRPGGGRRPGRRGLRRAAPPLRHVGHRREGEPQQMTQAAARRRGPPRESAVSTVASTQHRSRVPSRASWAGAAGRAALPGYEARPGQLAMAERIADAIDGDERLLVEAGTGTGKTLAYLVPALLSGRKVVVSTGTKTLQDQIARVDLPRLRPIFAAAGRRRAWMGGDEGPRQLRLPAAPRASASASRALVVPIPSCDRLRGLDRRRRRRPATAPSWPSCPTTRPLWREVAATPETRIGPRCAFFESCFVTAMRRRAPPPRSWSSSTTTCSSPTWRCAPRWPEAQVLPPYEVVIFDEAHQIEDVATEFFGVHVSTQRLFALARDLERARRRSTARARTRRRRACRARRTRSADALRDRLPDAARRAPTRRACRFPDGSGAARRARATTSSTACSRRSPTWLDARRRARCARRAHGAELAAPGAARGGAARRSGALVDRRPRARACPLGRGASPRNVALHASPVDVGPLLARAFDACPGPIVFTSATLTVAGSFDYVRARLGLGDTAAEATFPSPFGYAAQALLYLAPDLPEPNDDALRAGGRRARGRAVRDHRRARAAAVHQLPQPARRRGAPARDAAVPAAGAGRAAAPRAAGRRCATASARCCWRRRASGRASTSPARRCRWW